MDRAFILQPVLFLFPYLKMTPSEKNIIKRRDSHKCLPAAFESIQNNICRESSRVLSLQQTRTRISLGEEAVQNKGS